MHRTSRFFVFYVKQKINLTWPDMERLMGVGKFGWSMLMSIHPCLLKKILSTLSLIYNSCWVVLFPIWKVMGSHTAQMSLERPREENCLLHGIKSVMSKFNWVICCGPTRQIFTPESGNIFISSNWMLMCLGRQDDRMAVSPKLGFNHCY